MDVHVFLRRAEDFSRGMNMFIGEDGYQLSAGLLAIHSAIAYADALRTGFGDAALSADDHREALSGLRQSLNRQAISDTSGLGRLATLLNSKSAVAYGRKRTDEDTIKRLCTDAERFASWANRIGADNNIDGWRIEQ